MGSPPRMRGKHLGHKTHMRNAGITPAHAGKTLPPLSQPALSRDHPRACGENVDDVLAKGGQQGSPPRMRGKLGVDINADLGKGITPAHAGKTSGKILSAREPGDHPRACGENMIKSEVVRVTWGSPPRMRGKHFGKGVFPWLILVLSLNPL